MNEYDEMCIIDSFCEHFEGVDQYDFLNGGEYEPQPRRDFCNYCGKDGLAWAIFPEGWRLVNRHGKIHDCRKKARDKQDRKQIERILRETKI